MRAPAHPAPLASWCIALVMVLALLAVFLHWLSTPGILGDLPLMEKFRVQIEDFLSVPPSQRDRPRGVMLASSGAMCAVAGPQQLSSDGPDLLVLPLPLATFDDFIPIVERLAALQPDFIIIQAGILIGSTPLVYEYVLFVGYINHLIRKTVRVNVPEHYPVVRLDRTCRDRRRPNEVWQRQITNMGENLPEQRSHETRARIVAVLETFDRASVPIMVVEVPRNVYSARYGESLLTKSRKLIKSAPRPIGRITFHQMTELFPTEQFLDPLHVMSSVRPKYRAWLRTEIRKALSPP